MACRSCILAPASYSRGSRLLSLVSVALGSRHSQHGSRQSAAVLNRLYTRIQGWKYSIRVLEPRTTPTLCLDCIAADSASDDRRDAKFLARIIPRDAWREAEGQRLDLESTKPTSFTSPTV
jgi:hypothetical protein